MRPRRTRHSTWAGPTLRPKRAALTGVAGLRSGPAQADPQRKKQRQEKINNETLLTDADHFSKIANTSVASLRS
jgi:hypothetical protein